MATKRRVGDQDSDLEKLVTTDNTVFEDRIGTEDGTAFQRLTDPVTWRSSKLREDMKQPRNLLVDVDTEEKPGPGVITLCEWGHRKWHLFRYRRELKRGSIEETWSVDWEQDDWRSIFMPEITWGTVRIDPRIRLG